MTHRRRGWLLVLLVFAGALLPANPPGFGQTGRSAFLLTVDGAIGAATADYHRGLDEKH